MKQLVLLFFYTSASLLSSCASIINGTNQQITVLTPPVNGAQCSLENDKGKWQIAKTPGDIVVRRSDKKLRITCEKEAFEKHSMSIKSELSKVVYGNILVAGGAVGSVVDRQNGSAFTYPSEIYVPLTAEKTKT